MISLVVHNLRKIEAEATYILERQRVNRERFRDYCKDFEVAYHQWDYRRIREVIQDATVITNDTLRLVRRMSGIQERLSMLRSCRRTEGEPPAIATPRVARLVVVANDDTD